MLLHGHLIRLIALFRGRFPEISVWVLGVVGGCRFAALVLTQRESLVSQARVGLGGVAGGGLTHWADRSSFCRWPWLPRAIAFLDVIIKLSPVNVTTLGGAFRTHTMTLIARAICPVTAWRSVR
jgi:hypothetical protein